MTGRDERGVGTALTAGTCAVLLVVAWLGAVLVGWVAQASAAQDAADLAALAAAGAQARGEAACDAARAASQRNGAEMVACRVAGDAVSFVVEVRTRVLLHPQLPGAPPAVVRVAAAGSVS